MTKIVETAHIGEPAGEVWEHVGRFSAIGDWHAMVAKVTSEGDEVGSVRRIETTDGATSIERLIEISSAPFFYRYSIEASPLPVRDYVGELRVDDNGDGTSTVVWAADFELALSSFRTLEGVRSFIKTGLTSISDQHRRVLKS